jgi:hypothetical protein
MPERDYWERLHQQFASLSEEAKEEFREVSTNLADENIFMDGEATPEEAEARQNYAETLWYQLCRKHGVKVLAQDHEVIYLKD